MSEIEKITHLMQDCRDFSSHYEYTSAEEREILRKIENCLFSLRVNINLGDKSDENLKEIEDTKKELASYIEGRHETIAESDNGYFRELVQSAREITFGPREKIDAACQHAIDSIMMALYEDLEAMEEKENEQEFEEEEREEELESDKETEEEAEEEEELEAREAAEAAGEEEIEFTTGDLMDIGDDFAKLRNIEDPEEIKEQVVTILNKIKPFYEINPEKHREIAHELIKDCKNVLDTKNELLQVKEKPELSAEETHQKRPR